MIYYTREKARWLSADITIRESTDENRIKI